MLSNVLLPDMGFISDDVSEGGQRYELKLVRRGGGLMDVMYRAGGA